MFDKLIESNSAGAEFKPRLKFFMVSSVVVGIMFLSAVVFSLYAQEIDLGTDNFELSELLAPQELDVLEPEPPREQPQQRDQQQTSELPSRQALIARNDQPPKFPPAISTTPNTQATIPVGRFVLDPTSPERNGSGIPTGPAGRGDGTYSAGAADTPVAEVVRIPEPPPAAKVVPKPPATVSRGVVNGTAIDLPKPAYPAVARSINLTGSVNVQVLINESGDVVSAKAVDGHPFFKLEAERAAKRAKFKPTRLSDVPVKVNGIIVYRFTK